MNEFFIGIIEDLGRLGAPYILYQFALIGLGFFVSWYFAKRYRPKLNKWLAKRTEWPNWFRLFIFSIGKNLSLLFFVIIMAATRSIMLANTIAPRSYFIKLATTVGLAFLAIALFSRLIKGKTLRRLFRFTAWGLAAIHLLGYTNEMIELLDGMELNMGSIRLTVYSVVKFIGTLIILFFLVRVLNVYAHSRINNNEEFSPSLKALSGKISTIALYAVAIIIGFQASGLDLTFFAILSGAVAFGLGFGMQKVVSNLISGLLLLLDRSIKPGDVISVGDTFGWITSLGARYVSVNTRDGREFLIPNEELITGQVVNWTHSNDTVRLDVHFGTSYDSDPKHVKSVCLAAIKNVARVKQHPSEPVCHITGFGESSIDFVLRFWISDPSKGLTNVRGDVYQAIWDAMKKEGIELPFPQRDIRIRSHDTQSEIMTPNEET